MTNTDKNVVLKSLMLSLWASKAARTQTSACSGPVLFSNFQYAWSAALTFPPSGDP